MEASIWFYTFSTAAQVMAGLVGLFAVFVVYKIQDFGDILETMRKQFVNAISHASSNTDDYDSITYEEALEMDDATVLYHTNKLLGLYSDAEREQKMKTPHLTRENRDLFQTLITTKRSILRWLAVTLVLSLIAIALSLFALIATNYFIVHNFEMTFQVLFFLYFLFCLIYMGLGIYKIAIK
ncbi:MAG: hypothetical protein ABIT47_01015 [Candidatus Paceibacterota bacterium]